jgi:predicted nucleotide-binding protein (sugar kinase/HSP70/actin superfamily)
LSRFINAVILADLLNNLYYKIKPYEVIPQSVDQWRSNSLELLYKVFRHNSSIIPSLKRVGDALSRLQLDYLRPKAKVKIIGEIFSHLHEGHASYGLPSWLIDEGAEPVVEPLSNWLEYLFWQKIQFTRDRAFRGRIQALKTMLSAWLFKTSIRLHYTYFRYTLNNRPDKLARQRQLARYASPYYHSRLIGGEGHMEAGKHIYAVRKHQAHMVISIKPFSCMPSTQSDGVQTKISEDLKGSLFVAVDTTGDAEVNVKSRILMKLQIAQKRAEREFFKMMQKKRITEKGLHGLREKSRRVPYSGLKGRKRYISTATRVLAAGS